MFDSELGRRYDFLRIHLKSHFKNPFLSWFGWINLIFVVTGVTFFVICGFQYNKVRQAPYWPRVQAQVIESQVEANAPTLVEGKWGNYVSHTDRLVFCYKYSVSGHDYTATDFYCYQSPSAYSVTNGYPVGTLFKAYYNPQDPNEAVVDPGFISWGCLWVGLIFAGVGAVGLYQTVNMR